MARRDRWYRCDAVQKSAPIHEMRPVRWPGTVVWHRNIVSTPHSRIRPERHDLVPRRGDHVEAPLHVADCEVGHVVHVERPLRAEDGEPPPRLTAGSGSVPEVDPEGEIAG
jgi:hypothetical protein